MHTVLPLLAMLALVALSGLVARWLPRVPLPLLQIALGALVGWPPGGLHVEFHPQIFMLLFIPPMLFADGWQMPQREFGAYKWPIVLSSTVLVLFTVGALGYLIRALVPVLPMPVAFLLAAVLSPTDAVAVSAILQRQHLPAKLRHIIEGEALMNDAAALVAVKFAIAATLTQSFSLSHAVGDFVWVASGGVAVGVLFSWGFKLLHDRLLYWREERAAAPTVLLLLLMPFAPYLIAEHLGLSGVLAAVSAGMAASAFDVRSSRFNAFHLQTQSTWSVILFVFNGLIFTLVGLQLPQLVQHLPMPLHAGMASSARAVSVLLGTTLLIALGLLAVRFVGLAGGGWLARRFSRTRPGGARDALPVWAWSGIAALGGTRGGITLAAVLGVPLLMPDGSAFPARELLVFQAAMVIVLSLVIASVGLPWMLRRLALPAGDRHARETAWARQRATRAALQTLESAPMPLDAVTHEATDEPELSDVRARVDHGYRHRLRLIGGSDPAARELAQRVLVLERQLRLEALQAERDELRRLRLAHRINDETLRVLTHEIDLVEMVIRARQPG